MTTIHADPDIVTQVNVFKVAPENQDALARLLIEAVQSVAAVPGWLSASIHKSLDGTKVVNYAQASEYGAWEAVFIQLQSTGYIARINELAQPDPCLYHCCFSLSSD